MNLKLILKNHENKMPLILAFLFSGFLWGMQTYKLFPNQIENPFSYIMGGIFFFLFTTLPLITYYKKPKNIFQKKEIIYSFFFWILSFLFLNIFSYQIFLLSRIIFPVSRLLSVSDAILENSINIFPLIIGSFSIGFLILGILLSEFTSFVFTKKTEKKFYLLYLLIPIVSAIIGNLFDSLFLKNIICFSLIGVLFAINLLITIKENENTLF